MWEVGRVFLLIYTSQPRVALSQDVLREISETSQAMNTKRNVTGALMMAENVVMQILEGEENDVRALYQKILHDKRHMDCEILVAKRTEKREFGNCGMTFHEVGTETAEEVLELIGTLRVSRAMHDAARKLAS